MAETRDRRRAPEPHPLEDPTGIAASRRRRRRHPLAGLARGLLGSTLVLALLAAVLLALVVIVSWYWAQLG